MLAEALLAASFQIGPFYEQKPGLRAVRPLWAEEGAVTDVVWPVFTKHRDWWRFCWFLHYQNDPMGCREQFDAIPLWFNGRDRSGEGYWGLFPVYGHHPDVFFMHDWDFLLWPLWMRYKTPRPAEDRWMTSNVVLFPFLHWRDDGSWGVWPLCGFGRRRESRHSYALWPIATWASYDADRDTPGAGRSWMLWPLVAEVERERESQWMLVPPFFSYAETSSPLRGGGQDAPEKGFRVRCPWPLLEFESTPSRDRWSVFPIAERTKQKGFRSGEDAGSSVRIGWKLVELLYGGDGSLYESRVFPFWTRGEGFFRLWPLWARESEGGASHSRFLELFPIRWVPAVDRNWAKFWTFYECDGNPVCNEHSLLWGIIRWRTFEN